MTYILYLITFLGTIEDTAMETIKVWGKSSGMWLMCKKEDKEKSTFESADSQKQQLAPSNSIFWISKKPESREGTSEPSTISTRSATETSFWPANMSWKEDNSLSKQEGMQKVSPEITIPKTFV